MRYITHRKLFTTWMCCCADARYIAARVDMVASRGCDISAGVDRLTDRVRTLTSDVRALTEQVRALIEQSQSNMRTVEADMREMQQMLRDMQTTMSHPEPIA